MTIRNQAEMNAAIGECGKQHKNILDEGMRFLIRNASEQAFTEDKIAALRAKLAELDAILDGGFEREIAFRNGLVSLFFEACGELKRFETVDGLKAIFADAEDFFGYAEVFVCEFARVKAVLATRAKGVLESWKPDTEEGA